MRKWILLGALTISLITIGCTQSKTEKAQLLKDAYFSIGEKIKKDEELKSDYVKSLLDGYEYEKGEFIKGELTDYEAQQHIFKNDNEKLIIADATTLKEKSVDLIYESTKGTNNILLSSSPSGTSDELLSNVTVSDANLYEELSLVMDVAGAKLLSRYNEIAKDILLNKNITIDDIQALIKLEPTVEESTDPNISSEVVYFSFGDGSEILGAYCIKGQDKINRVSYGNNDIYILKNTIDSEISQGDDYIISTISTRVKSIDAQEQIMNLFSK